MSRQNLLLYWFVLSQRWFLMSGIDRRRTQRGTESRSGYGWMSSRTLSDVSDTRSRSRVLLHLSDFTTHLAGWFLLRAVLSPNRSPHHIDIDPNAIHRVDRRSDPFEILFFEKKRNHFSILNMRPCRICRERTSLQVYFFTNVEKALNFRDIIDNRIQSWRVLHLW